MKVKKLVAILVVSLSLCLVTACGSEKSNSDGTRPFIEITSVPDGWSELVDTYSYYYEVDTNIVYIGRAWYCNDGDFIKLESEEFDGYIYDSSDNKFVGFNR